LLCDDDIIFQDTDALERLVDEYPKVTIPSSYFANIQDKSTQAHNHRITGAILYPTITFHDT